MRSSASFAIFFLSTPCLAYHLFNSRDPVVRPIIEQCRADMPNEAERSACYGILRCILNEVPSDYTARWSAGASILAFIPTIVALMSNSITEISSTADESTTLAVILSLSSVTAFTSRFGDMPTRSSNTFFQDHSQAVTHLQNAWSNIHSWMIETERRGSSRWWQGRTIPYSTFCLVLLVLSAGIWYEVYEISTFGIVVNACPVKVNMGLWVGMSQLLSLLNVACRHQFFDIRRTSFRFRSTLSKRAQPFSIVLRSPRTTTLRWTLQTSTAIASFALYTYGTVILASTTLIPASDAIRAMVVLTASAGFGRLIGYWAASPSRTGNRIIVVDVPAECMEDFHKLVQEKAKANE